MDLFNCTIIEFLTKQINTKVNKNLLKTLALCSSNSKIRLLSAQKLDLWLQNGKLQRYAIELMLYITANTCDSYTEENLEILMLLVRLRALRSKQIMAIFQLSLKYNFNILINFFRELLENCPGSLSALLSFILENEFSFSKYQHNMSLLQIIFNFNFLEASEVIFIFLIKNF